MAIFAVTMLLALSSRMPVSIALMTGVAGMLVTGVLNMDEAYAAINWKTVFLMACLIPLGWAMDSQRRRGVGRRPHASSGCRTACRCGCSQVALGLLTTAFSLVISHVGATDRDGADGDQPRAGRGRRSDRVRADRGAVGVEQLHDRVQPGDLDDHRPRRLHRARNCGAIGAPLSLVYTAIVVVAVNLMF